jgi:hypothetical protein
MKRFIASSMCLVIAALLAHGLGGCTSLQSQREQSATGGLELTLFVRDATEAEAFFQVNADGTLGWAGGIYARLHSPKWTGAMTAEEIAQLRQLINDRDFFRVRPASSEEPPKQIYRILINAPEHRARFTVKGHSPELEPIRELLAKASLRRLEDDLNRLPAPSSQRAPETDGDQQ